MAKSKKNPFWFSQGSVLVTVFLSLIIIGSLFFIYYYYTKLSSLGPPPIPLITTTPTPNALTVNWKTFTETNKQFTIKYPQDWYVSDDNQYISQFPYDPRNYSKTDFYNVIHFFITNQQIQSGYTNQDWLNRIDHLNPGEKLTNEYRPSFTLQLIKLGAGTTASGQHFVMFKNTYQDEGVTAILIKNEFVYQFVLQQYDQTGVDTLQEMMSTLILN